MRLKRIELKNWCQHRSFKHDFPLGLTGIFGPNGSGKSNLVRAIEACFTADFGDVVKERKIYRHAAKGAKAFAEVTAVHDGIEFTLRRSLSPSSQRLSFADETLTTAVGITAWLERVLKLPIKSLADLVFVKQNRVTDFLRADYEERARAIGYLCGTGIVERLWKLLGEQLSADQGLGGEVVDTSPTLLAREEELNKRLYEVGRQLRRTRKAILKKAERRELKVRVAAYEKRQRYQEEIAGLKPGLLKRQAAYEARSAAALKQYRRVRRLLRQQQERQAERERLEQLGRDWSAWAAQAKRRKELEQTLQTAPPAAPPPAVDDRSAEDLKVLWTEAERRLKYVQKTLQTFAQEGVLECPTCATPVVHLEQHLSQLTEESMGLPDVVTELHTYYRDRQRYDQRMEEYRPKLAAYEARQQAAREELANLGMVAEPDFPADEIAPQLARMDELDKQLEQAQQRLAQRRQKVKVAEAMADHLRENLQKLDEKLRRSVPVTEEQYRQAQTALELHRPAITLHLQQRSHREELQGDLAACRKDLQELRELQQRYALGNAWLGDLAAWRSVAHRDCWQRVLAESFLEELVDGINNELAAFETPFRVQLGAKLTFQIVNRDGSVELVEEQSGGEQVVLALAYRMAVNRDELLVLDEPTAGLDTKKLGCLGTALKRLGARTKQEGRQVIIVTHDPRLEKYFDHIIQVEPPLEG